jgi:photoactive yellow protein
MQMIKVFSKYEAELESFPQLIAKGKNYFKQVMPCTCNRLFYERFKMGILLDNLNYTMADTLTYRVKPTNVIVHLYRDPATKTKWVFVQKR